MRASAIAAVTVAGVTVAAAAAADLADATAWFVPSSHSVTAASAKIAS
jgi:hypothetical protein